MPFTFPKKFYDIKIPNTSGSSPKEHTAKYFPLLVSIFQLFHGAVTAIQVFKYI